MLQQKNIDKAVFKKLSSATVKILDETHETQFEQLLIQLVKNKLDPNTEIKYLNLGKAPLLSVAMSLLRDLYNPNSTSNFTLIELLLDKGANPNQTYYNHGLSRESTPLADITTYELKYPSVYEELKKLMKKEAKQADLP